MLRVINSRDGMPHDYNVLIFQFFTFEQFQKLFHFGGPDSKISPLVSGHLSHPVQFALINVCFRFQTYSLAGLGSGVTEAIIVNPFEVVKVKMQANRAHQSQAPSTASVGKEILRYKYILGKNHRQQS